MVIFYILAPLPTIIARRYQDDVGSSNACKELALFLTAGIVISAYGLPIVLARAPIDSAAVVSDSYLPYGAFVVLQHSVRRHFLLTLKNVTMSVFNNIERM